MKGESASWKECGGKSAKGEKVRGGKAAGNK